MLLRQGVHPKVVQERLGHANVGITLDIYSHVSANMQSDAAERIDAGMRRRWGTRDDGIDTTDRTFCPVFEQLAVAYHEGGHAVGAVLVSPPLVVETVTIVPDDDYLGRSPTRTGTRTSSCPTPVR